MMLAQEYRRDIELRKKIKEDEVCLLIIGLEEERD